MKRILIFTTFLLGVVLAQNEPTQLPILLNEADPALTAFFFELLSDLQTSEQALIDAQEQMSFLGEALALANTRVYGLSDENGALAEALDDNKATLVTTETYLEEFKNQLVFKSNRVAELAVQVTDLDTQLSSALMRVQKAENKALALEVYEVQVTHLDAQLQNRQRRSAELALKVTDLEAEVSSLEAYRTASDETIRNLSSELKSQTQARRNAEVQIENLENQWDELSVETASQLAELVSAKASSEDLEIQLQNRQKRAIELAIKVTDLETELSTNEAEVELLERQLQAEEALRVDATTLSREAVNELRILQVYTASLQGQLDKLAPSLDDLQAEARTLVLDFQAVLSRINEPDSPENSNLIFDKLLKAQQAIAKQLDYEDIYVVKEDDTLSTIASSYYDDSERWAEVFEANTYLISDQDRIFPGLVLIMPP